MRTTHTPKKTSPEDWHPADIVAAVRKRGLTLRKLSVARGLGPGALKNALSYPYIRAQAIIAEFIGVPPQEIWPSRYNPDGTHVRGLICHVRRQKKFNASNGESNANLQGAHHD